MGVAISRPPARLSPEDRDVIAGFAARATWPAGFLIYERRARADGIFIVLRGHVVLRSRVKNGRGFVPSIVGPDETFGAEGLAPSGIYGTDAIADVESETLFLGSTRMRSLMRECPQQAMSLVAQMASERVYLVDRLREVATMSVEQRLIAALVRLAGCGIFTSPDGRLELTAARYRLLCEYVGATRESVSVVLGRLAAEDLVDRTGSTTWVAPLSQLVERFQPIGLDQSLAGATMAPARPATH